MNVGRRIVEQNAEGSVHTWEETTQQKQREKEREKEREKSNLIFTPTTQG
jgi:hypothetical protein